MSYGYSTKWVSKISVIFQYYRIMKFCFIDFCGLMLHCKALIWNKDCERLFRNWCWSIRSGIKNISIQPAVWNRPCDEEESIHRNVGRQRRRLEGEFWLPLIYNGGNQKLTLIFPGVAILDCTIQLSCSTRDSCLFRDFKC